MARVKKSSCIGSFARRAAVMFPYLFHTGLLAGGFVVSRCSNSNDDDDDDDDISNIDDDDDDDDDDDSNIDDDDDDDDDDDNDDDDDDDDNNNNDNNNIIIIMMIINNDNNNNIQMRDWRFFILFFLTVSSLRRELSRSPARTLKWPGCKFDQQLLS